MEEIIRGSIFGNVAQSINSYATLKPKKKNLEEEKFYYYFFRDALNRPMVTACIITGPNGVGKGLSVCSNSDNPEKKIGKEIAKRRALKAYWEKRSGDVISCKRSRKIVESTNYFETRERNSILKIEYNPELTEHEERIIYGKKRH